MTHFICTIFGHWRSRSRARLKAGTYVSVCRWCETPMVRVAPREWRTRQGAGEPHQSGADPA